LGDAVTVCGSGLPSGKTGVLIVCSNQMPMPVRWFGGEVSAGGKLRAAKINQ
jgi:hypothetical protein